MDSVDEGFKFIESHSSARDQLPATPCHLLPKLGPKSAAMLQAAGITTLAQLHALGSVQAYVLAKRTGCKPSLNLLWGLEGAITGEHWQHVARHHRTSLLLALDQAERESGPAP